MNFDVSERTILRVTHGSRAYGLNTSTSDLDIKGVCIEPLNYHYGFLNTFEQFEHMGSKTDGVDTVIYSLKKFARLAADCNPNIIEVLHVDDSDVLFCDRFGEELRSHRDEFLSKKARWTFSGYSMAQLKHIKTHRKWLLDPPKAAPTRKQFGLSETSKVSKSELGCYDAMLEQGVEIELSKELLTVFTREKQYQAEKIHFDQYINWTKTRNPVRAALEAKFGLDTKHAMHLVRLMRMCNEILTIGKVVVKRPDREELLAIRNGAWTYDQVVSYAEELDAQCAMLYETSLLPREANRAVLDNIIVDMTEKYLRLHG